MELFDACCALGPAHRYPLACEDASSLLTEMDRLGIGRALVSHTLAARHAPDEGNRLLREAITGHARLEPCWVLIPGEGAARPGREADLCRAMAEQGVAAIRLCPRDHGYPLTGWMAGDLLKVLAERRYLLLLDLDQVLLPGGLFDLNQSTWRDLAWVCTNFPCLSVLLTRVGYRSLRVLLPLLRHCPNLHVDLSYFATHEGVEQVVTELGPDRILFGSGQPYVDGGGAVSRLRYASVTPDQAALIAGGNLARLLSQVRGVPPRSRPPVAIPAPPAGDVRNIVHGGRPFTAANVPVLDAHGHLGPYPNFAIPAPEATTLVGVMDRCGVTQLGIASHLAIGPDWIGGNRVTASAVAAYPNRLFGYAVADPNQPEHIRSELAYCLDGLGLVGLKLHPDLHEVPIGEPGYAPAWEFAAERECVVLVHTFHGSRYCDPTMLRPLAERYPRVPIVLVHSGAQPAAFPAAIALARACPNIFLDLSGSFITGPWIARMVAEAGAERVIFSSDIPFIDLRYSLGRVAFAGLAPDALSLVLGGNIDRIRRHAWSP